MTHPRSGNVFRVMICYASPGCAFVPERSMTQVLNVLETPSVEMPVEQTLPYNLYSLPTIAIRLLTHGNLP